MKAASHTRLVSRILVALTLSGVLHAGLPTETPKKKVRMANVEPASETRKPKLGAVPQES